MADNEEWDEANSDVEEMSDEEYEHFIDQGED